MRWRWRAALLLGLVCAARASSGQQCAGDLNGDQQVSIAEIQTLVDRALNGCSTAGGCPYRFDRATPQDDACEFVGIFNSSCPGQSITVGFVTLQATDGSFGVAAVITEPFVVFTATTVGATFAAISAWDMPTSGEEPAHIAGTIRLSADGSSLTIDPSTPPFAIAGCPFQHFEGAYEGTLASP